MTEPVDEVQHIFDAERRFNGADGRWAVCGDPMPQEDLAGPRKICPDCLRVWNEDRRPDGEGVHSMDVLMPPS